MELTEDVIPNPHDDEVKEFYLMTPEEVTAVLLKNEFKTNSAAVMIDFFIRHGLITADEERDYPEMSMRLHRYLPSRFRNGATTMTSHISNLIAEYISSSYAIGNATAIITRA